MKNPTMTTLAHSSVVALAMTFAAACDSGDRDAISTIDETSMLAGESSGQVDAFRLIGLDDEPQNDAYVRDDDEATDITEIFEETQLFNAYAPPLVWGSWVTIASHIGSISYTINYSAVGNTLVLGQVRYWAPNVGQVTKDFNQTVSLTTSNSAANVEVRFKGIPFGSAVKGTIEP